MKTPKKCERAAELVLALRTPLKDELKQYRSLKVMKTTELKSVEMAPSLIELQQRKKRKSDGLTIS